MKILHYSLGLPPYRTGGLTKYSYDLMKEQVQNNDEVYLLFPGQMCLINKVTKIKHYKNQDGIKAFELINPLPVSLLNGISEPGIFIKPCNLDIFKKYLKDHSIEIVHVHTMMGLYKEFLEACKSLNIKIVYTTHDYFGICTKVNFLDNKGNVCNDRNIEKCLRCNQSGYSIKMINILQSRIYRELKNKGIINKLKDILNKNSSNKRTSNNDHKKSEQIEISDNYRIAYKKLLAYYNIMFTYIDKFLFNSSISKEVYEKYLDCNGEIVSITHSNIKDNRKLKDYNHDKLRLTYLGPDKEYKGFNLLIDAIKELNNKYKSKIELNLYGDIGKYQIDDNINVYGRYSYEQLETIFDQTDLLIVPSIWYETFGFITLEALSYGVPVLVTDRVGSKDLITQNDLNIGIVINLEKESLKDVISKLCILKTELKKINKNIKNSTFIYHIKDHYKKIKSSYKND
ncbi:glycosyltransferase [Clostridium sp. YIM B02555]|uniref:glycosyltransferase n=1 Tax=Clostridium sp. YIM B02555 TaxID=2911968 RepID=UPI001EED6DDD|nr:glycosyltransferase [Clostridium sp. YIM B02555]